MGKVHGYSELKQFAKSINEDNPGCLVDTNFIVACVHRYHRFYEDSQACFKVISETQIPTFYTHTAKTEFLDIERKYILTQHLSNLYNEQPPWKGRVRKSLIDFLKPKIEGIKNKTGDLKYLNDSEIKDIKLEFFPRTESGKDGWIEFCSYFLESELNKQFDLAAQLMNLKYFDIRGQQEILEKHPDQLTLLNKKVDWDKMIAFMASSGLSSSDAMMINVFKSSKFRIFLSSDLDSAYSIAADTDDSKVAFIPDKLLSKHRVLFQKLQNRVAKNG